MAESKTKGFYRTCRILTLTHFSKQQQKRLHSIESKVLFEDPSVQVIAVEFFSETPKAKIGYFSRMILEPISADEKASILDGEAKNEYVLQFVDVFPGIFDETDILKTKVRIRRINSSKFAPKIKRIHFSFVVNDDYTEQGKFDLRFLDAVIESVEKSSGIKISQITCDVHDQVGREIHEESRTGAVTNHINFLQERYSCLNAILENWRAVPVDIANIIASYYIGICQ